MAHRFVLSKEEFRFVLLFMEEPFIKGLEEYTADTESDKKTLLQTMENLKNRSLITETEEGKVSLDRDLLMMVSCAAQAKHLFLALNKDADARYVYYFLDDIILLFSVRNNEIELLWIPFLNLAIGAMASALEPYLNDRTISVEELVSESMRENDPDGNRLMEGFDGFDEAVSWCETIGGHAQWYFMTQEEKKGDLYLTGAVACTDGEKTFLFYREGESGEKIWLLIPGKADYVNCVCRDLVRMHADCLSAIADDKESRKGYGI